MILALTYAEDLYAVIRIVSDQDIPSLVDGYSIWGIELSFFLPWSAELTAELGQEDTLSIENLYSMVESINNIDSSLTVNDDTARMDEFSISSSRLPKLEEKVSLWVELLHPVILAIRYVNASFLIERKVARIVECPLSAFVFPVLAESEQELPFGIKLLNAVVICVNYPKTALRVEMHTATAAELGISLTTLAKFHHEAALCVELVDAIQHDIGDIAVSCCVNGDTGRISQLTHLLEPTSLTTAKLHQERAMLIELLDSMISCSCYLDV